MVNVLLRDIRIKIRTLDETQEELIYNLYVRPGDFQNRFIFLWVEDFSLWVDRRWYRPEQVLAEHFNRAWVHWLRYYLAVVGNIVEKIVQSHALYFFRLGIARRVTEIEDDVTLVDFLHEEVCSSIRRYFVKPWKLFEVSFPLVGNIKAR